MANEAQREKRRAKRARKREAVRSGLVTQNHGGPHKAKQGAAEGKFSHYRTPHQAKQKITTELIRVGGNSSQTRIVKAILHQVMEPATAYSVRLSVPGFVASLGTALAKTISTETIDWTKAPAVQPDWNPMLPRDGGAIELLGDVGHQPVVLLRDPVVSHIVRTFRPVGTAVAYYDIETAFLTKQSQAFSPNPQGYHFQLEQGTEQELPLSVAYHRSGWVPYGEKVVCGQCRERVIWIDASPAKPAVIHVSLVSENAILIGNHISLDVRRYNNENTYTSTSSVPFSVSVPVSGGNSTFANLNVLFSGYYSIRLDGASILNRSEIEIVNCSVSISTEYAYKHVTSRGMLDKTETVNEVRVNGSSMLITNTAPTLVRGGTVYGLQISGMEPWYEFFTEITKISDANVECKYTGDWAYGMYTFVKPQGDSPLSLEPAFSRFGDSGKFLPMFRPFRPTGAVVALVVPPTNANETFDSAQFTMQVVRSFEFTTTDQFFDIKAASVSSESFDMFVRELGKVPNFFENKYHWSDITRLIEKAARFATEWAPTLGAVGQGVLGVAHFIDDQRQRRENMRILRRAPGLD